MEEEKNKKEGYVLMSAENEVFQEYYDQKIGLYGLGTETEKALLSLEDRFEIVGLLDSFQEEGELYGKEIYSLSQILERGVTLIIVVARPGSCKAIAKKIGDICRECGVALLDIRGKDLLQKKRITYDFTGVDGGTKAGLYQKIAQAEAVSFDLFDTLIMREVLSPTDIAELADEALQEKGICIPDFVSMRLEAEKRLAKYGAPTLEEIYEDILSKSKEKAGMTEFHLTASELAVLEWEIDYKTILARRAVCEVYEACISQGKAVYIVTDTYYRKEQIESILRKCNLSGYSGLLVSCEYHTGKRQELFKKLKEMAGERKYLHIGDDLTADLEMASKAGMDTWHIFSGEELSDLVGNMGLEPYMDSLPERLKVGMFTARLFNDPFQFETEDRMITLSDSYDVGYLVCAPIIADFVFWFRNQVRHCGIQNIWFSARDGYLVQKLYRMLEQDADSVYFQTSRMAAIRAGVMDDEDIAYVDSMRFSGTLEESLKARFGLDAGCLSLQEAGGKQRAGGKQVAGLLAYKESILRHAADERKRYRTYIDSLDIQEGDIAFFDFVAKGTTQMYVQRIVARYNNGEECSCARQECSCVGQECSCVGYGDCPKSQRHHLKGLYFLQLEPEFMADKGLDITSFYGTRRCGASAERSASLRGTEVSSIYEDYYVLETILTAPHPCICGFDDEGSPVYVEETRSEADINCFLRAQEGILDYFRRYLELLPPRFRDLESQSKRLDEMFLELIHNLRIMDEDFLSLIVEDPFFNRMTEIRTLV